jgi:hypothetical protein
MATVDERGETSRRTCCCRVQMIASYSEYPFALVAEGIVSLSNGLMLALQARKRPAAILAQESALFQLFDDIQENPRKQGLNKLLTSQ